MSTSSNKSGGAVTQFLTCKEAADRLRLSENALAKMRLAGNGPPFTRIGRRIRYGEDGLGPWLSARTYTALPPKPPSLPSNDK